MGPYRENAPAVPYDAVSPDPGPYTKLADAQTGAVHKTLRHGPWLVTVSPGFYQEILNAATQLRRFYGEATWRNASRELLFYGPCGPMRIVVAPDQSAELRIYLEVP